jgi:histidine triad (HIT) family protein
MSDCLFCKIAAKQIPSQMVKETDDIFAFRDINPQAPKHILIVPKKHIAKLADATAADVQLIGRMMVDIAVLANELKMDADGFRVVINNGENAGQSVFHLHAHLMSGRPFGWPPG